MNPSSNSKNKTWNEMEKIMRTGITAVTPVKFFTLTFILSWLIWIPLTLSHFGIGPFHIPESTSAMIRLLGVLMPATSALILTAVNGGRDAIRALLSRLTLWQVNWKWWLVVILAQPVLLCLTALLNNLLWRNSQITLLPVTSIGALSVNVIFLLIAVLGEEIGWHGVGFPALQQQRSALKASLILALIWATWHLPFWFLLDTFDQFGFGYIGMNFLLIMPLTIFSTWFFNHTKFSILLPVVFHLTFNIVNTALLPVTINIAAFWLFIIFDWGITILLLSHLEPEPGSRTIRSGLSASQM